MPVAIVLVLVVVFIVIASLSSQKNAAGQQPNQAGVSELKKKDAEKTTRLYDMINLIVGTYTDARTTYPAGSQDGWDSIVADVPQTTSFTDPYTNTFYRYTAGEPDFGEISYKPGADCDTKKQTFKSGTFRMIALRAKFYDGGVRCISSVEVQAKQSKDVR